MIWSPPNFTEVVAPDFGEWLLKGVEEELGFG
jgi:hypothetical protein